MTSRAYSPGGPLSPGQPLLDSPRLRYRKGNAAATIGSQPSCLQPAAPPLPTRILHLPFP